MDIATNDLFGAITSQNAIYIYILWEHDYLTIYPPIYVDGIVEVFPLLKRYSFLLNDGT